MKDSTKSVARSVRGIGLVAVAAYLLLFHTLPTQLRISEYKKLQHAVETVLSKDPETFKNIHLTRTSDFVLFMHGSVASSNDLESLSARVYAITSNLFLDVQVESANER
jgi:hypothetical protein